MAYVLFPIVRKVVDELASEHGLSEEAVASAIGEILHHYEDTHLGYIDVPYKRPDYRCAYAYLYLCSHVRLVEHFLDEFWDSEDKRFVSAFEAIRRKGNVRVCSVGGGPGSDLLGVCAFVNRVSEGTVRVKGKVLDQYTEWGDVARKMLSLLSSKWPGIKVDDVEYDYFNFFKTPSSSYQSDISGADLVTMVKFMSAVGYQDTARTFRELLSLMKPGSLLFFVDNSGGGYRQALEMIAESLDFSNLDTVNHHMFQLSANEVLAMKCKQIPSCSFRPQKTSNLTASLWLKGGVSVSSPTKRSLSVPLRPIGQPRPRRLSNFDDVPCVAAPVSKEEPLLSGIKPLDESPSRTVNRARSESLQPERQCQARPPSDIAKLDTEDGENKLDTDIVFERISNSCAVV